MFCNPNDSIRNRISVQAFAPYLSKTVIVQNGFFEKDVSLVGIDSDRQRDTTNLEEFVKEGDLSDLKGGGALVLVGTDLMKLLGVRVHNNITLVLPDGGTTPVKIVGSFTSGNRRSDESTIYASLRTVQRITGSGGRITTIIVKLKNINDASAIAAEWSRGSRDRVESWDGLNEHFKTITRTQDITRLSTLSVLILVISFGIYNILNMAVAHKKRDIAILRSIGYERWDVVLLFLYQGFLLGVTGALLGLAGGFAFSRYMETVELVPGMGGMTISFDFEIYVQAFLLAVGAAIGASWLPSWKAGKLAPIQIIREAD